MCPMTLDPTSGDEDRRPSDAALGRRAQILATEHWGLLAARGTAQSEVLTRITIYLTLVSAGLVTISILGQASRFGEWFAPSALGILAFLVIVGFMTQTRVANVAEEDMMYVVAMNRLRGAYVDLDPAVQDVFLSSITDDQTGLERTYSFLRTRSFSHLFGSSAMLIVFVNATVTGLFCGSLVYAPSGVMPLAIAVGVLVALLVFAASITYGYWTFRTAWRNYRPRRRSTERPVFWRARR
jgi:hypothetical protein